MTGGFVGQFVAFDRAWSVSPAFPSSDWWYFERWKLSAAFFASLSAVLLARWFLTLIVPRPDRPSLRTRFTQTLRSYAVYLVAALLPVGIILAITWGTWDFGLIQESRNWLHPKIAWLTLRTPEGQNFKRGLRKPFWLKRDAVCRVENSGGVGYLTYNPTGHVEHELLAWVWIPRGQPIDDTVSWVFAPSPESSRVVQNLGASDNSVFILWLSATNIWTVPGGTNTDITAFQVAGNPDIAEQISRDAVPPDVMEAIERASRECLETGRPVNVRALPPSPDPPAPPGPATTSATP